MPSSRDQPRPARSWQHTRALLVVNPIAGGRGGAGIDPRALQTALQRAGVEATLGATEGPGHATDMARRCAQGSQTDLVLVCGGDGTQREVAAGLAGSGVALGILPGGTTNVLARELELPLRPLEALRRYLSRPRWESRRIDVGRVGDHLFLMMMSLGLDARTLHGLRPEHKRLLGRGAVLLQALGELRRYDSDVCRLLIDGAELESTFAAICNIRFYGGPVALAPRASWSDGLLDIVLLQGPGRRRLLSFGLDVLSGTHDARPDVRMISTPAARILGAGRLPAQIDGDAIDLETPVDVTVERAALELLEPPPAP